MRSNSPFFKISRRAVLIFWLLVISGLLGFYFFAPEAFYRVTQMPYQRTPYVNTPRN